jgi:hypothetical protein
MIFVLHREERRSSLNNEDKEKELDYERLTSQ